MYTNSDDDSLRAKWYYAINCVCVNAHEYESQCRVSDKEIQEDIQLSLKGQDAQIPTEAMLCNYLWYII